MRTRAAVLFEKNQPMQIEDLDLAGPREDEVLVRIQAAGICHSDWHVVTGDSATPLPAVLGHEGAGVVEAVGSAVSHVRVGQQVVLSWSPYCGHCFYCLHDRKCLCPTYTAKRWAGTLMDGSTRLSRRGQPVHHFCAVACFADHAVVHASACVPLPEPVDPRIAALVGCAVTTGVGAAVRTVSPPKGSSIVVLGAGGVGLSTIMGAVTTGGNPIIAIDRSAPRCQQAKQAGATHALAATNDLAKLIKQVHTLTEGRGADYVFEAVGDSHVQSLAIDLVRPGGTVVLEGLTPMGSHTPLPTAVITRKEISIVGSYYGTADPMRDMPTYVNWYQTGRLPLSQLLGPSYTLDQINDAYADLLAAKPGRGVIVW